MNFLNSPFAKMMDLAGIQNPLGPKKSSPVTSPPPVAGDGTNMQGGMWTGGSPPPSNPALPEIPEIPGQGQDGVLKSVLKKIFAGGMA
jgi:hypothetical protein